ncbi:MAG: hypothetical protein NVS2B7_26890 [Herpetosiphon sp.]
MSFSGFPGDELFSCEILGTRCCRVLAHRQFTIGPDFLQGVPWQPCTAVPDQTQTQDGIRTPKGYTPCIGTRLA